METHFEILNGENALFARYQKLKQTGADTKEALDELALLLLRHAIAVTYIVFRSRREDVAQDAVIAALTKIDNFRGESKFSTWFHAVALNEARTALRKEIISKRAILFDESALRPKELAREPDDTSLQLELLIQRLSPEDQAFIRDKLEGRVENELAEKYGLTTEGIRSRWERIRRRLRQKIG